MFNKKNFVLNHSTHNDFYNNLRSFLDCSDFKINRQKYSQTRKAAEKSRLARKALKHRLVYWK